MEKIENVVTLKNVMLEHLYHQPLLNEERYLILLWNIKKWLSKYVTDTSAYLHQALKEGKKVLLEGQLGSLRILTMVYINGYIINISSLTVQLVLVFQLHPFRML